MPRPKPTTWHKGKPYRSTDRSCGHEPDYRDPAYDEWYEATGRSICAWGCCVEDTCPVCGTLTGNGFGAFGCPCDVMPGWVRVHQEQRNKPHPPVKAKGRHADRITNSAKAHKHGERYLHMFDD